TITASPCTKLFPRLLDLLRALISMGPGSTGKSRKEMTNGTARRHTAGNRSGEQALQPADDADRGLVSSLTIARAGSTRRTSPADTPAYIAIASIVPVACRPGAGAANRGSGHMPPPAGLAPAAAAATLSA